MKRSWHTLVGTLTPTIASLLVGEVRLSRTPSVCISFYFDQEKLLCSCLSLSEEGFSCQFFGAEANERNLLVTWLEGYLTGKELSRSHLLSLLGQTPFSKRVLETLQTIPFGKTASYQEIANHTDSPNGARAVGMACHHNPFPLLIPCHRVIKADGSIGGFAADLEIKRRLLAFEDRITA